MGQTSMKMPFDITREDVLRHGKLHAVVLHVGVVNVVYSTSKYIAIYENQV